MPFDRARLLSVFLLVAASCATDAPPDDAPPAAQLRPIVARTAVKPAGVPEEFVATPVGFFHPSCLVYVAEGATASAPPCAYEHYDRAGRAVLADGTAATEPLAAPPPAITTDIEGWSLADHTAFMAGVSHLTATWKVPPTPVKAGQTLFFFPGTQSLDGKPNGTILQPVLAYENAQWFVQSWNCCESGNAQFGAAVPVSPGHTIVGTNIGTNCSATTGICTNWQIRTMDATTGSGSVFDTQSFGHPHQWIFGNVLEAYGLKSCDQLPTTGGLTYHGFAVLDIQGHPIDVNNQTWTFDVDQQLSGCGTHWGGWRNGTDFNVRWGDNRPGSAVYDVVAPFSGKCLDVAASGTANGTKVQEYACNGTKAQGFKLGNAGGGTFTLVNVNSGKCVDITGSGTANGTQVQQWTCNGTSAQAFRLTDVGTGLVNLVNTHSGKCIDVAASGTANGTKIQQYTCNGTGAQRWRLTPR